MREVSTFLFLKRPKLLCGETFHHHRYLLFYSLNLPKPPDKKIFFLFPDQPSPSYNISLEEAFFHQFGESGGKKGKGGELDRLISLAP